MRVIKTKNAPAPIGPYNQAIEVGNQLFLSGQVAINPANGELVMDDIATETEQVFANIKAVLTEAGYNLSNVVKASIFLKNMDDFNAVNEVYGAHFVPPYPARECVQVAKLPKDVNVEISIIAVK